MSEDDIVLASSDDPDIAKRWITTIQTHKRDGLTDNPAYNYYLRTKNCSLIADQLMWQERDNCPTLTPQPRWIDFINNPTIANAEKLCNDFRIFVPEFTPMQQVTTHANLSSEILVNVPIQVAGNGLYKTIGAIDFLHDISSMSLSLLRGNQKAEFATDMGAPEEVAQMFKNMTNKFTKYSSQWLNGQLPAERTFSLRSKSNLSDDLFMFADVYKALTSVLHQRTCAIMLDSFVYSPERYCVMNGVIAAFVLLCLRNIFVAHEYGAWPFKGSKVTRITFLNGNFNKIDGSPLCHFVDQYIKSIAEATGATVAYVQKCQKQPIYFKQFISPFTFRRDIIEINGLKVHVNDVTNRLTDQIFPRVEKMVEGESITTYFERINWCMPYRKSDLRDLIRETIHLRKTNTSEYNEWMKTIANLNFLRDAYRIDVIAQYANGLFITCDHMAYNLFRTLPTTTTAVLLHLTKVYQGKSVLELDLHVFHNG